MKARIDEVTLERTPARRTIYRLTVGQVYSAICIRERTPGGHLKEEWLIDNMATIRPIFTNTNRGRLIQMSARATIDEFRATFNRKGALT